MKIASRRDIRDFVEEVKEALGEGFEEAILYGSYARNDHDTGSDIDIAFKVSGEVNQDEVFRIVDQFNRERDLMFSPRFFDSKDFKYKLEKGYSFYLNIEAEGVEI